jgi:lysine 2,3-aminomutase
MATKGTTTKGMGTESATGAERMLPMVPAAAARSRCSSERPSSPPDDWRWQLRNAITTVAELDEAISLGDEERAGAARAEAAGLPLRITPYYLSLIDRDDPRCPIRRQVVPRRAEATDAPGDLIDPLGEETHTAAPMLVRRYPDRALLLATDQCAIYCRFCTRSRLVGGGKGPAPASQLDEALAYLEGEPQIRDVILSGGDPLTVSTRRLVELVARLRAIPHVEIIRLATRVPVALPQRITGELVAALRPFHPLWVMTHFNHPLELTPEARAACERLVDGGFPVMNQTVLLRGVNDDADTLETLFRGLVRSRVKPYYLHQMDPVRGTAHLRTPIATGIAILEALQGRLSGIAIPKLIVDAPGGMGKVPIAPDYVVARGPGRTVLRTHRGVEVTYLDPVG